MIFLAAFVCRADDGTDRVRAIRVPNAGQVMKAQAGMDGIIHLLGDADGSPQYLTSTDGGLTFSTPIPLVDAATRKPGLKFTIMDLAVGRDGCVHAAFMSNGWQLKLPKEEWGFYYASLAAGAKAFTPLRNINGKPSEGFSIAAGEGGAVTACFLSRRLFTMSSRDGGATFSEYAELDPAWNPCVCCTTSATYGGDGRLALLYREETNNDRDIYMALWDQGRGSRPSRTRISTTPWKIAACPMTYFTLVPTANGYLAAWPTKGEVYFARMDRDGAVLPPGEIKTPATSGMRTGVLALGAPDGATLIAAKNKDVLTWQLYDAKGRPQGVPGTAPGAGSGAAGVALPNGKFVLFP
jgi:hypothetical protein